MNDRQKREFEAGLAAEVDAWLKGDYSRREFLTKVGQATGMLALSGTALSPLTSFAFAQGDLGLADPSTPLGMAQEAAMKASMEGPADGSAFRAVEAAKPFSGVTLSRTVEATPQVLDLRNFSCPAFEQLTGVKSSIIELSHPDQYRKAHRRAHRCLRCL